MNAPTPWGSLSQIDRDAMRGAVPPETFRGMHVQCPAGSAKIQTFRTGLSTLQCRRCSESTRFLRQNNRIVAVKPTFVVTVVRGGCAPATTLTAISGVEPDAAEVAARWTETVEHMDGAVHSLPKVCRKLWPYLRVYLLRREPPAIEALARAASVSTRTLRAVWRIIRAELLAFWFAESDPAEHRILRS